MTNVRILKDYHLKWRFKEYPYIKISDDKYRTIINTKNGKIIKKSVCSSSIGYWINRKFVLIKNINNMVELIPKVEICPF